MLHDGDADAVEARVLVFLKLLEFVVREIHRVGIERGEHPLDGCLSRLLVIDVAGILQGDGGDGFVVVLLDVCSFGVGNRSGCWHGMTKTPRAPDRAADYGGNQDERAGNNDESSSHNYLRTRNPARQY